MRVMPVALHNYNYGLMRHGLLTMEIFMTTTAALLAGALLLLTTLSWSSHRQTVVAQSTPESEWHAAADAAKEAAYIKNLFYELGIDCPRSVPLKCDNQSTIKQSLNQVDQRRCRHLGMKTHFLRQQCHAGHLSLYLTFLVLPERETYLLSI